MSRLSARLDRLEGAANATEAEKPNAQMMIPELRAIGQWCNAHRVPLWEWTMALAQVIWDDTAEKGREPTPDELALCKKEMDADFASRGWTGPRMRFFTLPGVVVDFAIHICRRRSEDAERDAVLKLANTAEFQPAWDAMHRKLDARRDPQIWDHEAREWRMNPPVEAVAREVLFCYGWPGG